LKTYWSHADCFNGEKEEYIKSFVHRNYNIRFHTHSFYELNIVLGGRGEHLLDKMRFEVTYPNSITASETHSAMIPLVLDSDELCVRLCLRTCTKATDDGIRAVWIKDTLSVGDMYISEALVEEAQNNPILTVLDGKYVPEFNENGDYIKFKGVE